jgi:hypothetical protein
VRVDSLFFALVVSAACSGKNGEEDSSPPSTDDSAVTIEPDDCDDHATELLCIEGAAVTCDAEGDIAATEDCSADPVTSCFEGAGCGVCAPTLAVPYANAEVVVKRGIFLAMDASGVTDLASRWMLTRPVEVALDPIVAGAKGGSLVIDVTDPLLVVLDADGNPLELPATLPLATTGLFLWSATPGQAELVVRYDDPTASCTDVEARLAVTVGQDPGLSGRTLSGFPWFEQVRAFNETEPVHAAVDPSRLFDRAGLTADLYVVPFRSDEAWTEDTALVDVSGGAETMTIGSSLEKGAVEVWKNPNGGSDFGLDYQLVLDFGQDGRLDPGDVVTGFTDDALLVARDLSSPGPLAVTTVQYSGGTWLGQRTYFPTDIAKMDALPLVVVSHGNGHDYTWYDYVGEHLASYGMIVMAHQNNTGPGIETASETTLTNTDYLLENLGTIASAALDGHVDSHRIMWIGHSRGGEGVVRAYDRIFDKDWTPTMFSLEDIALVVSIAPTVFNSVADSDPHRVPYHLIAGTADGDVTGGTDSSQVQFFRISQAARGESTTWYVHGASHNDFNCCGSADGSWWGATDDMLIGPEEAQAIAKTYFLVLAEHYLFGHDTVAEYLTRMFAGFRGSGVDPADVVATTFHGADNAPDLVVDDFQSNEDPALASGGGAVVYDVTNVYEDLLDDANRGLNWNDTDPMNGMTQAEEADDLEAGVVFDWDGKAAYYEVEIPAGSRDLRAHDAVSLRAAQGSRHPNTVALGGPLTFTVTLMDGAGGTSSIDIDRYGELPETYGRWSLGEGVGWANEFVTVRIPLAQFEADGAAIDRADITAIRLEFGPDFGSEMGRIGLDDLEVTLR